MRSAATDEPIDLPAFASAFGRAVHDAGIPSTPERAVRFAQALALAPPRTRAQLYWTARTVFVSAHGQLATFDRVFAAIFAGVDDPADLRGDLNAPPLRGAESGPRPASPSAAALGALAEGGAPPSAGLRDPSEEPEGPERTVALAAASSEERLGERNFAELGPEELRALQGLMRALALAPPPRRTRRARRDRHGERLDLRATLRASRRTGGDPLRHVRRRRRLRPRRLVVLCDISGSMEPYSRAFLQFLHAAVGGADAEAFVFATRLTRLTRALRGRQPDLAIERATQAARDWSGGTRIGAALQRFNDDHGRRGMARGAVVVIVSDGWERGDPALVGREMERLQRLAHRIVWVNPRKASRDFAPLAGGMAAALPFCDAFVSGHSLHALSAVAGAIAADEPSHQSQRRDR
jgi:uncharacterized protein with von Willebrand factor type A (vWA) domain